MCVCVCACGCVPDIIVIPIAVTYHERMENHFCVGECVPCVCVSVQIIFERYLTFPFVTLVRLARK